MKRLIYCLDGTSNKYDAAYPTNVVMMHKSIAEEDDNGIQQTTYYDEGVGTDVGQHVLGGALGFGLMNNILQAYEHLCRNYQTGDEIYIFGFSRGAYTARSFAGLIRLCSIIDVKKIEQELKQAKEFYEKRLLKDETNLGQLNAWRQKNCPLVCANDEDRKFRSNTIQGKQQTPDIVKIRYIGVWDTVKTIGVNANKYKWHDHSLSPHVEFARHAVALDERRKKFDVTEWDNIEELNQQISSEDGTNRPYNQMWFPGVHGSIGGGGPVKGLSDEAFQWIREGAKEAGLQFISSGDAEIFKLEPNSLAWLDNSIGTAQSFFGKIGGFISSSIVGLFGNIDRTGPNTLDEVSHTAIVRFFANSELLPEKKPYRPISLNRVSQILEQQTPPFNEVDYRALFENSKDDKLEDDEQKIVKISGNKYLVHTVIKADSLSSISKEYTGEYSNWKLIHEANQASIPNPDLIYIGQRIFIPFKLTR